MSFDYDKLFAEIETRYTSMEWEAPQYSKSQIVKAGKNISTSCPDVESFKILNNWRSSHAYPLQVITSNLRRNNRNAIVVQRLKRLDSIAGKLKKFPDMSLYRMQDLGGCRVILPDINSVYKSIEQYKSSRIRHILKRENDYIMNPKVSGYRSYHLVYQFHSDKKSEYNNHMLIEIQFRTDLQHIWATAVETMGIYTKTALKSSIGDADTLRFFSLVSSIFAYREGTPLVPSCPENIGDTIGEIRSIDSKLNIVSRISALSTAMNYVSDKADGNGYYILLLNFFKKTLRVKYFAKSQVEAATKAYDKIESINDPNMDCVLVSANSFNSLKSAYPNYFVDISKFVKEMRNIL